MAFVLFWLDKNVPERSIMPFLIYFFPLHVKTKQNAVWPRFDPFFFFLFFSCHFLSFTGSLAFVVGRDTVIFSYT